MFSFAWPRSRALTRIKRESSVTTHTYKTAISKQSLQFCFLLWCQLSRDNEETQSHFQSSGLFPIEEGLKTG